MARWPPLGLQLGHQRDRRVDLEGNGEVIGPGGGGSDWAANWLRTDARTLFMVVPKWFGPDRIDELLQAKTARS